MPFSLYLIFHSLAMDKILIVDDEKYIIQHITTLLKSSGYEVGFISSAHTEDELAYAAAQFCAGLDVVYAK